MSGFMDKVEDFFDGSDDDDKKKDKDKDRRGRRDRRAREDDYSDSDDYGEEREMVGPWERWYYRSIQSEEFKNQSAILGMIEYHILFKMEIFK